MYHIIRREPSCAWRRQSGEFPGTGKRRVEGDGKGGINRANMYTHARQTRGSPCGNGTGSMRAGLSWRQHARLGLVRTDAKVFHMLHHSQKLFLPSCQYNVYSPCTYIHGPGSLSPGTRGFFGWKHHLATVAFPHWGSRVGLLPRRHVVASKFPLAGARRVWSDLEKPS